MSHYSARWSQAPGDEQQAVPRGPRHERHPPGGGARPVRVQQAAERAPGEEAETDPAELVEAEEMFVFRGSSHPSLVLSGLNILRRENSFTDVKIKVEDSQFSVHKCVLSSFSPYFKAMFTAGLLETEQDVVTLNGVEPGMISGLIDYAYTGEITITKHNVQVRVALILLLHF